MWLDLLLQSIETYTFVIVRCLEWLVVMIGAGIAGSVWHRTSRSVEQREVNAEERPAVQFGDSEVSHQEDYTISSATHHNETSISGISISGLGSEMARRNLQEILESKDLKRGFNLRFEGSGYDGAALVRLSPVQLIFSDRIGANMHTTFEGEKLMRAISRELACMTLVLTLPEGVAAFGPQVAIAKFTAGVLDEEVSFNLLPSGDCPDAIELLIEFYSAGTRLYGLPLPMSVVSEQERSRSEAGQASPVRMVDLDATHAMPISGEHAPRGADMQLTIMVKKSGLAMTLIRYGMAGAVDSFLEATIEELDTSRVDALLKSIRTEVGFDFFSANIWRLPSPGSDSWRDDVALRTCCERAASAGFLLYKSLCANEDAKTLMEVIGAQPLGSRLTVATTAFPLPLELMYCEPFSKNWPIGSRPKDKIRPERFWGVQFAIETVRSGPGNFDLLRKTHWAAPAEVVINLNSSIPGEEPGPVAMHENMAVKLNKGGVACRVQQDCESMRSTLLAGASNAAVIYVYCHGSAAASETGSQETLTLAYNCPIKPTDVVPGMKYSNAPVVILNACNAGSTSPLLFSDFLQAFRSQDAIGVITTTFFVPVTFGATFGSKLIDACLRRGVPLGEQLRRLREESAAKGNLAPLFYSVQCQLDP